MYLTMKKSFLLYSAMKCAFILKSVFGVTSRKRFGYILFSKGIEENPYYQYMIPKCINEVLRLNRRIIALIPFISNCKEKCLPFFNYWRKTMIKLRVMSMNAHFIRLRNTWKNIPYWQTSLLKNSSTCTLTKFVAKWTKIEIGIEIGDMNKEIPIEREVGSV